MNTKEKKIESFKKPVKVLEANSELANRPEVKAQVAKVKVVVSKIDEICGTPEESSKSIASKKKRIREALLPLLSHGIAKINGHKLSIGAAIPARFIKQTVNSLSVLSEREFINLIREVKGYITTNKTALVAMSYEEEEIAMLLTLIDSFIDNHDRKEASKTSELAREAMLKSEIRKADLAIKNLDVLMECYSHEYPETYNLYKLNRQIKHSSSQPVSVLGVVTDALTGVPAQSATVKFYQLNTDDTLRAFKEDQGMVDSMTPVLVRKTTLNGRYNVRNLAPGRYVVVISKAGYETQRVIIFVNSKETTRLTIQLIKEE